MLVQFLYVSCDFIYILTVKITFRCTAAYPVWWETYLRYVQYFLNLDESLIHSWKILSMTNFNEQLLCRGICAWLVLKIWVSLFSLLITPWVYFVSVMWIITNISELTLRTRLLRSYLRWSGLTLEEYKLNNSMFAETGLSILILHGLNMRKFPLEQTIIIPCSK